MIYFDNSATTPIFPQSLDAYVKTSQRIIGNPSSLHDLGNQANRLLQQARKQIADLIHAEPEEIFFTSGGTEGDNWVLKGTMIEKREYGNHMIISGIEHPAVSETAEQLKELGIEVSIAPVDKRGFVRVDELKKLIRKETVLVSVMAVNNEVGSIQPIQEISDLLEDFATFSAHKFHGPRGTGFIYWKKGRRLAPLLTGGGQERNQRSGTENVPGIVAMAKALRLSLEIKEQKPEQTQRLKEALINALKSYDKVTIFSEGTDYAPHILCFALKGIRGEVLVHALEEKQIFVSTTSACSSRKHMASSTLHAMHVPNDLATSAIRISLDENNSLAEVEQFMIIFKQLYKKFSVIN